MPSTSFKLINNAFTSLSKQVTPPIKSILALSAITLTIMGCQSKPHVVTHPKLTPVIAPNGVIDTDTIRFNTTTDPAQVSNTTILLLPSRLPAFNIQGKIGTVIPATDTSPKSSGSAFYAWAQEGERFAIDLTGAMGIGRTNISYDGMTATLSSERTGTITASNPDELLTQAIGWYAPISQLPYWISGNPAPSDDSGTTDNYRRLINAKNGDWDATFTYADNVNASVPSKIKVLRDDGLKLIMTINHDSYTHLDDNHQNNSNIVNNHINNSINNSSSNSSNKNNHDSNAVSADVIDIINEADVIDAN